MSLRNAARLSRTAAGISSATKSLTSSPLRRLIADVQIVDAHHVERELRSLPANGFAVAGEAHAAFLDASRMSKRDVHGAEGILVGSTPVARASRDAGAKRAA